MDGMGMLMSAMGIDPEQIKGAAKQVQETADAFKTQLDRIESKLDFIGTHIDVQYQNQTYSQTFFGGKADAGSDT